MIQVIDILCMLIKGFDLELLFHWFSCSLFGVLVFPLWSGKVGASECICVYEMGKHPWFLPERVRMDILNCVFELRQTEMLWVKVKLLAKLQIMVCWYSCCIFILLQYSFVFFVENRWGSLPKSFRSNYKNIRSGRRKLCALLLCRKSRSLPLDVPCDSLLVTLSAPQAIIFPVMPIAKHGSPICKQLTNEQPPALALVSCLALTCKCHTANETMSNNSCLQIAGKLELIWASTGFGLFIALSIRFQYINSDLFIISTPARRWGNIM